MLARMAISETEAVAGLRILVAMAKADGKIHADERKSLAGAIGNLQVEGVTVESVLDADILVEAELVKLESDEAREQIYRSAFFLAHADGACSPEEQALLEKVAEATNATPELKASLERLHARTSEAPPASGIGAAVKSWLRSAFKREEK